MYHNNGFDRNGFPWIVVWMIMLQMADDDEEPPNYQQLLPLMQSDPLISLPAKTFYCMLAETDAATRHDCPICLSEIIDSDAVFQLDCSHIVHGDEMMQWMNYSYTCPVCCQIIDILLGQ